MSTRLDEDGKRMMRKPWQQKAAGQQTGTSRPTRAAKVSVEIARSTTPKIRLPYKEDGED